MSDFFRSLVNKSLIEEWATIIDWLLNDKKFDNWDKEKKRKFTRRMKKYFENNSIDYKTLKIDEFNSLKIKSSLYIYINSGGSECTDLIRHIRNGIAHGNCKITKRKDKKLYIKITDYNTAQTHITAKLNIPINLINTLQRFYNEIYKEIRDEKKQSKHNANRKK